MTQDQEQELSRLRIGEQIRAALEELLPKQQTAVLNELRNIKDQLAIIEEQVTKTNGRVNLLEIWKAQTTSVLAALVLVAGVLGWFLNWAVGTISALKPG